MAARSFLLLFILFSQSGSENLLRSVPNAVFGPGEEFLYDVRYGFIHGGIAKLTVLDTARIRGHLCHVINAIAYSNAALSIFFPVRDTHYSYLDVDGLFSMKITKRVHEGRYKTYRWTDFDPETWTATTRNRSFAVTPFAQDVISAFYYMRLISFTDSVDIPCFDDKKNYPLRVVVLGKEKVKTPLGRYDCLILEPKLASEGIFLKAGKIVIWVTDDAERIPVKLTFKLPYLGNITCLLEKHKRGAILPQAVMPSPAAPQPDSVPADSLRP